MTSRQSKQVVATVRKWFNRQFTFINLTLEDTTFYKGLAILMIVLHNFFHWVPPLIGENEQNFDSKRFENYVHLFLQPEYLFQATFSFLGHYGVQIFLFLSAYGLTKKYFSSNINYYQYIKHRLIKIYPPFIFSILIWMIYMSIIYGGIPNAVKVIISYMDSLLYKLTFISNFIPGELYTINGPWWFVSLIVQFYIIFPYMLKTYKKFGEIVLLLLSVAGLFLSAYLQTYVNIPLSGTILMHLPELSIGLLFAAKGNVTIRYWSIVVITIIFVLSNLYQILWYVSFSSVLILLLVLFQITLLKSNRAIRKVILFIGAISMYIFYINGFMRQPWVNSAIVYDQWYTTILICCLFVLIVISVAYQMMQVINKLEYDLFGKTNYEKVVSIFILLIFLSSIYLLKPLSYVEMFMEKPTLQKNVAEQYYTNALFHLDKLYVKKKILFVKGWVFDGKQGRVFKKIALILNNKQKFYRIELDREIRPDVSSVFKNNRLEASGFYAERINLKSLKEGTYKILLLIDEDDKSMFIDLNRNLKL